MRHSPNASTDEVLLRNFAMALAEEGDYAAAITNYTEALRRAPNDPALHNELGGALAGAGNIGDALAHFRQATQLKPDYGEAYANWGNALVQAGKPEEAKEQFANAMRVQPDIELRLVQTAVARVTQGRFKSAVEFLKLGIKLSPDDATALNELAWVLATTPDEKLRDGNEAVRLAERASALTAGSDAKCLGTLDAAYAEAGHFEQAITAAQRTERVAASQGQSDLARAAVQRLELYRAGKAYHQTAQ